MAAREQDIGWEHATPFMGNRKNPQCNYCGKVMNGGITRLKQHLAHEQGQVEPCPRVSSELRASIKKSLRDGKAERAKSKGKKQAALDAINNVDTYDDEDDDEFEEYEMPREQLSGLERKQLQQAIRESRNMAFTEERTGRHSVSGAGPSMPSHQGTKRGVSGGYKRREDVQLQKRGIDSHMFPTKQKSVKSFFSAQGVKKVGKAISKFFHFHAIPFNAADNGPYYQSMIDEIAKQGPGIKGPSGYQIGGTYLNEEADEIEKYISEIKSKWKVHGCTIMCDGWSTRNKHPIINFMIYCDRSMIYHSSVDCTNKKKTGDFVFKLMDDVVEEVGEENVVQVVTDNESSMRAAGQMLMQKRKNLFWSPCAAHCVDLMLEDIGKMPRVKSTIQDSKAITSFIYNSDKVVNLMKKYTKDRELLRPGITRFATEFIAIESLIRHSNELKHMCTSDEWIEYNNTSKRRKQAEIVSNIILSDQFWKDAKKVSAIMEPLVRVLKVVDQDKKPTLSIIYEAMDRAKLAIRQNVPNYKKYWEVIDNRWYNQLHQSIHAAAYFLNPVLQYSNTCEYGTDEVRRGLKAAIKRLEPDLDAQTNAMNQIRLFEEKSGEFGTALAQHAVNKSLPADWWRNYGEEAPHLQKIAIRILSQTCSSSGCERNWSTWSLIHTKLRNRLAIQKLHKLVYVHFNMRLRLRNIMDQTDHDDYYNPIDLNHIFHNDDILGEWMRENDSRQSAEEDDLNWLDEDIRQSEEDDSNIPLRHFIKRKEKNAATSSNKDTRKGKKK